MHKLCRYVCTSASLLSSIAAAQNAPDSADTATQYLTAWEYKDYPTMYRLSSPETRNAVSEQTFYFAASQLPPPVADPTVVKRAPASQSGEILYLQYKASGNEDAVRTSIVLRPGGVSHADLLSHASSAAPAKSAQSTNALANASPSGNTISELPATADQLPAKSVDGLTAEAVLSNMQKATQAVETMKADLVIHGNLMGENMNETGKLLYRAPNDIRVESKKFVLNGSGGKTILFIAQMNSYLDLGSMAGEFELAPGIGTPVSELKEKYNISLIGKSDVEGEPAYQLNLKPPSTGDVSLGAMMGGMGGGAMRMWVSAKSWLPIRAKISSMTMDYRNVQINSGGINDGSFVFNPPKDAQELNLGSMLGGIGSGLTEKQ